MRIHRFYIDNIDSIEKDSPIVTQETQLIHQLKNVFRYKVGQLLNLFNEKIGEVEVEISKVDKKDMSFKYIRQNKNQKINTQSKRQITLYMSVIKNSNFDLVVEKAVELGVTKMVPVITERTIKNNLNIDRLNKIIKEATEQSGRIELLKIEGNYTLDLAIQKAKEDKDIIYFGSLDKNIDSVFNLNKENINISIFIGPEGGFSDKEEATFIEQGFKPLRLGEYVLRAETAAILACGLLSL